MEFVGLLSSVRCFVTCLSRQGSEIARECVGFTVIKQKEFFKLKIALMGVLLKTFQAHQSGKFIINKQFN